MKRRIYWSLCAASAALALITALLTLWTVYGLLMRQAKNALVEEHRLISETIGMLGPDDAEYLNLLDQEFPITRVTIIEPNGSVYFDSDNDQTKMENHLGRPEIEAAFKKGAGEDIRRSATMGINTYYYAAKLEDGSVLRVSKQTSSIGAVFFTIIPVMVGILILILAAGMVMASSLTKRLLRPVEALAENLDAESLAGYDELEPLFLRIREQKRLINEQVERLREERDTIRTITSNMKEGMVLLGLERNVLSVNRSALALLGAPHGEYEGKNVLYLSRMTELGSCIDAALSGESGDAVIEREALACRIYASPVTSGETVCGAIVLLVDVTEQLRAEKVRREFSANVSHELRTPLTSISGFAEMIGNGMVASQEDVKKFAGRIYAEASRLITLTDDIIRLSRIEAEEELAAEPAALLTVCENTAAALRFTAEQRGVELLVSGEEVWVSGNARMLDELVYNLTDNALKYNREGGHVRITVRRENGMAALTVEDDGIGIPQEHQERIFERFYRVDKSRSKRTGGTGLGLSIVKHIVERHAGTVTLRSVPGEGTSVTVRLPLEK